MVNLLKIKMKMSLPDKLELWIPEQYYKPKRLIAKVKETN